MSEIPALLTNLHARLTALEARDGSWREGLVVRMTDMFDKLDVVIVHARERERELQQRVANLETAMDRLQAPSRKRARVQVMGKKDGRAKKRARK